MNYKRYCYQYCNIKNFDDILFAIEETGIGSFIIVDENYKLIGLISDGDIRRALINKEKEVSKIINYNPEVWQSGNSHHSGIMHMKKIHRNILPIVDEQKKVIDVLCLDEISFDTVDNPVVIMAGGLGSRLYPLTKDTPKPMLPINGKPILERIIEKLISQGFHEVYISINYLGEQIKSYFGDGSNWNISIRYIEETKKLGTAGALFNLKNKIDKPFIVMNGDIVTDLDFRSFLDYNIKTLSKSTMCVYRQVHQVSFGVVNFEKENNKIISMVEKPKKEYFVNMGIYVITPNVLNYLPENDYFDMPSLFQKLMNNHMLTNVYIFDGLWNDIGHIDEYELVNKY